MNQAFSAPQAATAAFGKLPWAGDFLKVGQLPSTPVLLDWLERGVATAANRGDEWKRQFDRGAQTAFVIPTEADSLLVGVMAPSRDAVGRRFPFVVYSELPRGPLEVTPHAAPLMLGPFLEEAGTCVSSMARAQADVDSVIRRIYPPDFSDMTAQLEGYQAWAQSATLRAAGQAVFGADWRAGLGFSLYVAVESIRPFHGQERPPTPLSIRLPLGAGYAGAAAFWLQVVRSAAGWRSTIPAAFWAFSENAPWVTIFFGQMPGSSYADLWEAAPDGDSLSNMVGRSFPEQDVLASTRPDLSALLGSDDATVAGLLRQIADAQAAT